MEKTFAVEYLFTAKQKDFKKMRSIPQHSFNAVCNFLRQKYPNCYINRISPERVQFRIKRKLTLCDLEISWVPSSIHTQSYITISTSEPRERALSFLGEISHLITSNATLLEQYYIVSICDDVSQLYCSAIYPKLGAFERKLKELMFLVYFSNYGDLYYQGSLQNSNAIKRAKKTLKLKDDQDLIQQVFWGMDIGAIKEILFTPRWTDIDEHNLATSIDSLSGEYSDNQVREFLLQLKPKSDWDRLFRPLFPEWDALSDITKIQKYRNIVAHCRTVTPEDYTNCIKIIRNATDNISSAITSIKPYITHGDTLPIPEKDDTKSVGGMCRNYLIASAIRPDIDKIMSQLLNNAPAYRINDWDYTSFAFSSNKPLMERKVKPRKTGKIRHKRKNRHQNR